MKKWLQLLIGIAVALVLLWVVSTLAGVLFWGLVALFVAAAIWFIARRWLKKRKTNAITDPAHLLEKESEDDIDRLIKEMERMAGK